MQKSILAGNQAVSKIAGMSCYPQLPLRSGNELTLLLRSGNEPDGTCFCMSFSCSVAFNGNSAILQLCVLHNCKIASASAASRFLDFSAPSC